MLKPKRCVLSIEKAKVRGTSTQEKSGYYIIVVFQGRYPEKEEEQEDEPSIGSQRESYQEELISWQTYHSVVVSSLAFVDELCVLCFPLIDT